MKMKHERYEKRLFRILTQAGFKPSQILTISVEQLVEIPGVTVPNIRTILYLQRKLAGESGTIRRALMLENYLRMFENGGTCHGN